MIPSNFAVAHVYEGEVIVHCCVMITRHDEGVMITMEGIPLQIRLCDLVSEGGVHVEGGRCGGHVRGGIG